MGEYLLQWCSTRPVCMIKISNSADAFLLLLMLPRLYRTYRLCSRWRAIAPQTTRELQKNMPGTECQLLFKEQMRERYIYFVCTQLYARGWHTVCPWFFALGSSSVQYIYAEYK